MNVKYRGELVLKEDLRHIADNYILTKHAKQKILERHPDLNVRDSILNNVIAYYNTDGSINCAINEYEYLVIGTDRKPYRIITFKEKSWNSINIFEKQRLAQCGFSRN